MGRTTPGATGRTLRALVRAGRARVRTFTAVGPACRLYTAVHDHVPAVWLVRTALRCFERGVLSCPGGETLHRTQEAWEAWLASPERAGLVQLLGDVVSEVEAADLAERRQSPTLEE